MRCKGTKKMGYLADSATIRNFATSNRKKDLSIITEKEQ
jgi:hypothetical protein